MFFEVGAHFFVFLSSAVVGAAYGDLFSLGARDHKVLDLLGVGVPLACNDVMVTHTCKGYWFVSYTILIII